jgi:hypothetical protein
LLSSCFLKPLLIILIKLCEKTRSRDPAHALRTADTSDFKTYLLWRKENSQIKKKSSMVTDWLVLSMVYQRVAQRYMDEGVMYDIRNVSNSC